MSPPDFSKPPYSFFSPPRSIDVSPAAMKLARDLLATARRADPKTSWVAVFDWSDERRVRERATSQWVDIGPGLDLAAYAAHDLPPEVAQLHDGVPITFKIPGTIRDALALKRIDAAPEGMNKLRLE